MKSYLILLLSIQLSSALQSQTLSKFSIELNYGLNGNFFVRSYDETSGPQNKTYLYKKNFLGNVGGLELKYHFRNNSALIFGYARSTNKGTKNFSGTVNGVDVYITDFNIRHTNGFYQLAYERRFRKSNPSLTYHVGLVLASMQQQEIGIENFSNQIVIAERNFKNSKLQEAGVFGGVQIQKKIDTKFEIGLRARAYYLVSVQTLEALTLTPTLTYRF